MDDDEAALAHIGETVADKYRLLRLLGAGGMGAVYEAEHVFTKRRVALKRMHPGIARSKLAAERFIREAQAPSAIGHPGIVQVLDGGFETDGSLYLVLELLEGVSMADTIEEASIEEAGATQIGIELLEALAAAHDKGFIHRDIKPDNVFLAHDGRGSVTVKLLDFGIASLRSNEGDAKLTQTGAVLGTPLYMSPEQATGSPIDGRSDLWSVGALLYRALAGKAPYDGPTYNALIVSIVTRQHAPLSELCPNLPPALLAVVEHALQKDPAARFANAEQMCTALKAVHFDSLIAEPSLPPYTSLRPVTPDRSATVARGRRIRENAPVPATMTRAAVGGGTSGGVSASENVHAVPPAEAGVPMRTPSRSTIATERVAGRSPLVRLAVAAALCLAAGGGLLALRDRPNPARQATAQLIAAESLAPAAQTNPPAERPAEPEPTQRTPTETLTDTQPSQPSTATSQVTEPTAAKHEPEGLPPAVLVQVLSAHEAEMQHCLEDAVVAQMLAGTTKAETLRLDVQLHVAQTGRVESVEVQGKAPADLAQCVRMRLLSALFPAAGAPTLFRYPLLLAPTIVGQ